MQAQGFSDLEPDPGSDFPPPDLAWTDDLVGLALSQAPTDNSPAAALAALLMAG